MNGLIILKGDRIKSDDIKDIVKKSDYVICADGGAKWAHEADIRVDTIIGDFDSLSHELIRLYENENTKIIKAPVEKDETDGVLAVDYAIMKGADFVTILGASGGRLDHQYGNIMLLKRLQNAKCNGRIILENGYAFMSNSYVEIKCNIGDTISVVPFDGELVINYASGLEYEIDNGTCFSYGYPIGISNTAIDETVILDITGGNALIFCYKIQGDQ